MRCCALTAAGAARCHCEAVVSCATASPHLLLQPFHSPQTPPNRLSARQLLDHPFVRSAISTSPFAPALPASVHNRSLTMSVDGSAFRARSPAAAPPASTSVSADRATFGTVHRSSVDSAPTSAGLTASGAAAEAACATLWDPEEALGSLLHLQPEPERARPRLEDISRVDELALLGEESSASDGDSSSECASEAAALEAAAPPQLASSLRSFSSRHGTVTLEPSAEGPIDDAIIQLRDASVRIAAVGARGVVRMVGSESDWHFSLAASEDDGELGGDDEPMWNAVHRALRLYYRLIWRDAEDADHEGSEGTEDPFSEDDSSTSSRGTVQ
jgi:hypothetical protein